MLKSGSKWFILLLLVFSTSFLLAYSNDEEDLRLIISLYEHQQIDLADSQIAQFQVQYPKSEYLDAAMLIKAKIVTARGSYAQADSILKVLSTHVNEPDLQIEILFDRASLAYIQKQDELSLNLMLDAEILSPDSDTRFQIMMVRGKIFLRQNQLHIARYYFEQALEIYPQNSEVLLEILNLQFLDPTSAVTLETYTEFINRFSDKTAKLTATEEFLQHLLDLAEYDIARKIWTAFLALNLGVSDRLQLLICRLDFQTGKYDTAYSSLSQIQNPGSEAEYLFGLISKAQGNFSLADSIFAGLVANSSGDISLYSWLERLKILYRTNAAEALEQLQTYIEAHQQSSLISDLYYNLGVFYKDSHKLNEAAIAFIKAKQNTPRRSLEQNILLQLAEIWMLENEWEKAQQTYINARNLHPFSRLNTVVLYNMAKIEFVLKNYDSAKIYLGELSAADSDKKYYSEIELMKGEMEFFQANYSLALGHYQQAIKDMIFTSQVQLRMAQALFYLDSNEESLSMLKKVKLDAQNAYQVHVLSGNNLFNLKRYSEALNSYKQAAEVSRTRLESDEAISNQALTLYQLKRFQEATDLYLQLSQKQASPESYLLLAGKSAFHTKDYKQALNLFELFVQTYPNSDYLPLVYDSIGKVYYNQAIYPAAMRAWLHLLDGYQNRTSFSADELSTLTDVFAGLTWSLKQTRDSVWADNISASIDKFQSEYIRFELEYLLLRYYVDADQWSDVLASAEELRRAFPKKDGADIQRIVAKSYLQLSRLAEADSTYRKIYLGQPSPEVLTEWADLDIKKGDLFRAAIKYQEALAIDTVPQRFETLLQFIYDNFPDSTGTVWDAWQYQLSTTTELSRLIYARWNLRLKFYQAADSLANPLRGSKDNAIKAEAQLLHAICLYYQKKFDVALIELYRIIYLYIEFPEFVLQAKEYLVKTYHFLGKDTQARPYFDEIKDSLSPENRLRIENAILHNESDPLQSLNHYDFPDSLD
jgi:tetratricopeptide (TPR) repeat protein